MSKKSKKYKKLFYINFVVIVLVIYWFMAILGKKRGKEFFPFFYWSLYSQTHVSTKTIHLDITTIEGEVLDKSISFYELTKGKIDFRQAEFLLEKLVDSSMINESNLSKVLKFLPNNSKSELYEMNSKKQKKSIQFINKPNN